MFSVYSHKIINPEHWHRLAAFAYLSERRPDAPPDTPDPAREVEREAERAFGPQFASLLSARQSSAHAVPRKGELTFVPSVEGVEFNPPQQTVIWLKDWQKVEFEMRAAPEHDGQHLRGTLTVFLGNIILADVALSFRADSSHVPQAGEHLARASARRYLKVFPSYSHQDTHIVEEYETYAESLGHEYLRDVKKLRSGQLWNEQLMRLIEQAEVFQLFWSSNSMRSRFVRQEWEFALSLKREHFIRPTYWEEPMPEDDGLPPDDLSRIHFHRLQRAAVRPAADTRPLGSSMPAAAAGSPPEYYEGPPTGSLAYPEATATIGRQTHPLSSSDDEYPAPMIVEQPRGAAAPPLMPGYAEESTARRPSSSEADEEEVLSFSPHGSPASYQPLSGSLSLFWKLLAVVLLVGLVGALLLVLYRLVS